MKTVIFDRVMGNTNRSVAWPKAATNRLEFGKHFPHGQTGNLFFSFPWQKFLSLVLKHLLLEYVVPWRFKLAEHRAVTGFHLQTHLLFHAGVSISLRVREFHPWGPSEKCVVTGKCSLPGGEAVQHLLWELCNHLPNLRQILNTSLFSIKMLLSP